MSDVTPKTRSLTLEEAEQVVLGRLILGDEWWSSIGTLLSTEDFSCGPHRWIFKKIAEARSAGKSMSGTELIYLLEHPEEDTPAIDPDFIGRLGVLASLSGADPRECAMRVRRGAAQLGARHARWRRSYLESVSIAGFVPLARLAELESVEQRLNPCLPTSGISSGWQEVDDVMGRLQAGELIVVAARPSMGRQQFVAQIATYAAGAQGVPVALFSLSMSAPAFLKRWQQTIEAVSLPADNAISLYIDDRTGSSIKGVRQAAIALHEAIGEPLGLIVIDELSLLQGAGYRDPAALFRTMKLLKALAMELKVPIIVSCELTRHLEDRSDKHPVLGDLPGMGAIERCADKILALYRDDIYHPHTRDQGIVELSLLLNRQGASFGPMQMHDLAGRLGFPSVWPSS